MGPKRTWVIDKTFEFDYAHQVWAQSLIKEFALDECTMCKHPHGHRGKLKVCLEAHYLDHKGMVIDFKELNFFKQWIDDVLDHKFICDIEDPIVPEEFPLAVISNKIDKELVAHHREGYYTFNVPLILEKAKQVYSDERTIGRVKDKYEGIVLVNFIPTSENLTRWFFNVVKIKLASHPDFENLRVKVKRIEFWETPKSHCIYEEEYDR